MERCRNESCGLVLGGNRPCTNTNCKVVHVIEMFTLHNIDCTAFVELILEKLFIELFCQELEGFSCSCVLVVSDFSSR